LTPPEPARRRLAFERRRANNRLAHAGREIYGALLTEQIMIIRSDARSGHSVLRA
jgi:hypothetical protein